MSNTILRVKSSIKNLFISALFLLVCYSDSYGQYCNQSVISESITITTSEQQTTTYSTQRHAFLFDASEGNTYTFATCNTTTGDTQLRLYSTAAVFSELMMSDNDCGANNKQSEIIWLCPSSGTYSILLTKKSCKKLTFPASVSFSMLVPDPCAGITINADAGDAFSLCSGSSSALNGAASISYNEPSYSHCTSQGNMEYSTSITNFTFNGETTIDNTTGKTQAYTDYSASIIGEAVAGTTYSNGLSMKINSDGDWTIAGIVWIDWNRNNIFEDSESYNLGSTTNSSNGLTSLSPRSINVPSSTSPGFVKVRVSCKWNTASSQCEAGFDGESEDYAILVTSPLTYTWSPTSGIANVNDLNANCNTTANQTYSLTVTTSNGCNNSDQVSVSVQDRPIITSPSSNISDATTCGKESYEITMANSASGNWEASPINSTLITTSQGAQNISVNPTNGFNTDITLTWTENTGACSGYTDQIVIAFNQPVFQEQGIPNQVISWLWGGLTNTDFEEPTNWYKRVGNKWLIEVSSIPNDQDAIFVQSNNASGHCVSETSALTITRDIGSLSLKDQFATAELFGDLNITGPILNNGILNASSGTITFNGTNQQEINGSGTTSFNNVVLNKTSGDLILNAPITIVNNLNFTSGNIVNGANVLTIGASSNSAGSITHNTGTVTGKLRRYFNNDNGAVLFPVGNNNHTRDVSINIQGSPGTDQYLTIEYVDGYAQGASGILENGLPITTNDGQLIDNIDDEGYWEIAPTNGDYSSEINTKSYDIEIHGKNITGVNDVAKVRILKSPGSNTSSENHTVWMAPSHISAAGTVDDFTLSASGNGFSFFTIGGSGSNALPVELSYFGANCFDNETIITWETESEYNSAYFTVEESRDGQEWVFVASVEAMGISTISNEYSIKHQALSSENTYYRLSQYDIDGAYEIFEDQIAALSCSNSTEQEISLYPNPNNGDFNVVIRTESTEGQLGTLDIINFNGAIIHSTELDIQSGFNLYPVQKGLSPGMYFLRIVTDNQNEQRIKFVVR